MIWPVGIPPFRHLRLASATDKTQTAQITQDGADGRRDVRINPGQPIQVLRGNAADSLPRSGCHRSPIFEEEGSNEVIFVIWADADKNIGAIDTGAQ